MYYMCSALSLCRYCGTNVPANIESTGNQLFIKFHTDSSSSSPGFLIAYTILDIDDGSGSGDPDTFEGSANVTTTSGSGDYEETAEGSGSIFTSTTTIATITTTTPSGDNLELVHVLLLYILFYLRMWWACDKKRGKHCFTQLPWVVLQWT